MTATAINSDKRNTVTVSVSKECINDRVGVTFRRQDSDQAIVVHRISASSLFAGTDLQVGMTVQKINDVDAQSSSFDLKQTMKLLREAEDVITIVARDGEAEDKAAPSTTLVSSFGELDETEDRGASLPVVPQHSVEVAEEGDHEVFPEISVVAVKASSPRAVASSFAETAPVEVNAVAVSSVPAAASSYEETEQGEINATAVVSTSATQGYSSHDESLATAFAVPQALTGQGFVDHRDVAGVLFGSIQPAAVVSVELQEPANSATGNYNTVTGNKATRAESGSDELAKDLVFLLESAFNFDDV